MRKQIQTWLVILGLLCGWGILIGHDRAYATDELELVPVEIMDPFIFGHVAFGMLVPDGWSREGQVVWDFNSYHQAAISMRLTGLDGVTGLEYYPYTWHTWAPNYGIGVPQPPFAYFPEGSNYLGTIVLRPMSAADYLRNWAIPMNRPEVQVVEEEQIPELEQEVRLLQPDVTEVNAARVRVQYVENGISIEEDFYTVLVYQNTPLGIQFLPLTLYSMRAPQGQLDEKTGLLHSLLHSAWVDSLWFANVLIVRDLFVQNQLGSIRAAGQLSQYLAQTANDISDIQMEAWQNSQDTYDRVFDTISDTIRGTADFNNPFTGDVVELPNDFSAVWAGANGGYMFSNDPGFNPNLNDTTEWQLITPVTP